MPDKQNLISRALKVGGDIALSAADGQLYRSVNTDRMFISGGPDNAVDSRIVLHGSAKASNPGNIYLTAGGGDIVFEGDSGTTSEWLRMKNGNVGIGTTNPTAKLEVAGVLSDPVLATDNGIFSIFGTTSKLALDFGTLTSAPWSAWIQSKDRVNNTAYPISLNPNGGNVGIGTTSPTEKLQVVGNIKASGFINHGSAISLAITTGAVTATGSYVVVTPQGGAVDDLNTVAGGTEGDELFLYADGTFAVTVKDGTGAGAFILAGNTDFVMDSINDVLHCIHNGTEWREVSRSSNS